MNVLKLLPKFKNDEERYIVAAAIGLPLICAGLLFIPPLVVYFGFKDKLTDTSKLIVRQYLNFMLTLFIAIIICTITVVGSILVPVIGIVGLIYLIIDLLAVLNGTEVQIPVFIEFLKENSPASYEEQPKAEEQPKDELKP